MDHLTSTALTVDCLCVCVFTAEMGIARLWLLVAGMLWVLCWSGQRANGQSGKYIAEILSVR